MVKEYIHFHTEVNKEVNGLDIQITPVILSRDRTFVEYKKGKFQRFYRAINISSLKITKFRLLMLAAAIQLHVEIRSS